MEVGKEYKSGGLDNLQKHRPQPSSGGDGILRATDVKEIEKTTPDSELSDFSDLDTNRPRNSTIDEKMETELLSPVEEFSPKATISYADAARGVREKDVVDTVLTEERKMELAELIKLPGPNNIPFNKAVIKRKKAIKTMEKYLNQSGDLNATQIEIFGRARKIVEDTELSEFIDTQKHYRQLLGMVPQTAELQRRNTELKAQKRQEMENKARVEESKTLEDKRGEFASKRKRSDDPLQIVDRSSKAAKPSTSFVAKPKKDIINERCFLLVDTSKEDGKPNEKEREKAEVEVLTKMVRAKSDANIFCESGFIRGYRCFNCLNEATGDFLVKAYQELNINNGAMKVIPVCELNSVRQPRGWIWVPKPYIPSKLLMEVIRFQNPDYNTAAWSVVVSGKEKAFGQHWLLRLTQQDLQKLKENKMELKVGYATSTVIIDGGEKVEPEAKMDVDTNVEQC